MIKVTMMKKLFVFLTMFLVSISSYAEVDGKDPYVMIQQVADNTFSRLKSQHDEIRKDPNLLKEVIREELLPYIDHRYAAAKIVGRKYMTKKYREEFKGFADVFKDYIVTSYAQIFTLYSGQEVTFDNPKDFTKRKIVSVGTKVLIDQGSPISINFKVRKIKKSGTWKAFDLEAEGISMLDSKKAELISIIRQKGLVDVTEMLKEKATKDIKFKTKES